MPWLFAFFARWGFGERVSRVLGYAAAVIGAAVLLGLCWAIWLHHHDRGVIGRHEAVIEARVTAATQAANDTANANDTRRQVEDARAAVLTACRSVLLCSRSAIRSGMKTPAPWQ